MRVLVPDLDFARRCRERLRVAAPDFTDAVEIAVWDINSGLPAPEAELVITARPAERSDYPVIGTVERLQHLHLLSLGYDWVLPYIPGHVTLSNSKGAIEESTAEFALALVLASLRDLRRADRQQEQRYWNRDFWTPSLTGARVLVLGYGGVGAAIVRRVQAFSPNSVAVVASRARFHHDGQWLNGPEDLVHLAADADVIVVALPNAQSTSKLIGAEVLSSLQNGALLVNVGRGTVVDQDALMKELDSRRIYAALDVVEPEPLPQGHPLWDSPNLTLTPHIGGNTHDCVRRLQEVAVMQVIRLARGDDALHLISR